jgi:hypothetical protein
MNTNKFAGPAASTPDDMEDEDAGPGPTCFGAGGANDWCMGPPLDEAETSGTGSSHPLPVSGSAQCPSVMVEDVNKGDNKHYDGKDKKMADNRQWAEAMEEEDVQECKHNNAWTHNNFNVKL